MNALAGASLPYLEGAGGGDGAGDGGGDGSAGDGAPIANATLKFVDVNGKEVTTTTNANGYYRINLRGLKAPLVATVVRNSKPWKSMLVNDIVRAPANRNFYTINLTGLTDVVASEVAKKAGLAGPDALTPAAVTHQKTQVAGIVAALNSSLNAQITAAGLNPATFNPLTTPFHAVATDSSDKLLESVAVTRDPNGGFTTVTPAYVLSGSISGLGGNAGLTLINGSEILPIAANATTFTFANKLAPNTDYNVTVGNLPINLICTIVNGTGGVPGANVTSVQVNCLPQWRYFATWTSSSGNIDYVVAPGVYDTAQTLSGTSAAGGGKTAVGTYMADKSWHPDLNFATMPSISTIYTGTVTPKIGAPATTTFTIRVAGFNLNFPTKIQPSGGANVTAASPVFTWSAPTAAGTYTYGLAVTLPSQRSEVWRQDNLSGTSVTYQGPALVPGTVYGIDVFTHEVDNATQATYDAGVHETFCFQCQ
jgi:hypothetical protein